MSSGHSVQRITRGSLNWNAQKHLQWQWQVLCCNCFTSQIQPSNTNFSLHRCTLLCWPNCLNTFLRGSYIGSSSLEKEDAIAGKSGTLWHLWFLEHALLLSHISWQSLTCCRKLLPERFCKLKVWQNKKVSWLPVHVLWDLFQCSCNISGIYWSVLNWSDFATFVFII